jgi:hypothetical protein
MGGALRVERRRPFLVGMRCLVVVWLVVVVFGGAALWQYKSAPGAGADAPRVFPEASAIAREPAKATLVMFVHPKCPCTRASVGELDWLVTHYGDRVTATVVGGRDDEAGVLAMARAIRGVRVIVNRAEAARFGAFTSGQTLLYDARGALVFSGGITSARGHAGESVGRSRIAALLSNENATPTAPVFGCDLPRLHARLEDR